MSEFWQGFTKFFNRQGFGEFVAFSMTFWGFIIFIGSTFFIFMYRVLEGHWPWSRGGKK